MIAFFGVGITTVVEAQANEKIENFEIINDRHAVYEFGNSLQRSLTQKESQAVEQKTLWKQVRREKDVLSLNVTLGVTYQGELYDLSLGDVKSSQLFDTTGYKSDNDRPRFAFVGISVDW